MEDGPMEKASAVMMHKPGSHARARLFVKQWRIHVVLIPVSIWAICIFYAPALGNIIAFENYKISPGFLGFFKSQFVGLKHFRDFFTNMMTLELFRNTLAMSVMGLAFGTLAAIVFALMLNEIRNMAFKRVTQTISYLPYFISMAICANLFIQLLAPSGPINSVLVSAGILKKPYAYLQEPGLFWWIITIQGIWKSVGWSAIIYIAAIASIDQEIYEAAYVDGAGRFKRIWYITLPSLMPTVAILLILNSGYLIMGGFEQQLLMYNPIVMDYAEVLQTYVYKRGIGHQQYSFAAAVNLFQSVISVTIILAVNRIFSKATETSIW
jgi:putative aldouronate transport system permease protein